MKFFKEFRGQQVRLLMRTFTQAFKFDVFDIHHEFSAGRVKLNSLSSNTLPRPGHLIRFGSFLFQTLKALRESGDNEGEENVPRNGVLFFVVTKNQHDALAPVCRLTRKGYLAGEGVQVQVNFPHRRTAFILALPLLPLLIFRLWRSKNYKVITNYYLDRFWFTYGYYVTACLWLAKLQPSAVVLANDHSYPNRTILEAARNQDIPTFYLQHAAVAEIFPILAFDYALLDGICALRTYDKIGVSPTIVFLIGMPKADAFYNSHNTEMAVRTLGIATNRHDPVERVEELCSRIRMNLPRIQMVLRPHPREEEHRVLKWRQIAETYEIEMSDPQKEISFGFLARCDAIIAGHSSILLEAAVINVVPLYYDFILMKLDDYGFLEMGLSEYFCDPNEICSRLEQLMKAKPSVRIKAKPYVHTIGTIFDGHSSELAASLIAAVVDGNSDFMRNWRRIPNVNLKSYELV
ncbi:MAG: hypothetical protein A4E63_02427 [Syntrophorhabdus sp. PtaU1.Bin050]|nr:MAG: hypothetical protein A4E63_02427 [Syntrophorhabdus sp. PtaU1.Bin050]